MMRILAVWRKHPWIFSGFLAALIATVFFTTRLVVFTIYWSDPAHRDQTAQGWMTPGYVANSWDIPRSDLEAALEDMFVIAGRKTLEQIAHDNNISLEELKTQIEVAIAAHRATQ
jgi:hypothetical protein